MTTKAYVLIEAGAGKVNQVVKAINSLKGVLSVDSISGHYDIVAIIEGKG